MAKNSNDNVDANVVFGAEADSSSAEATGAALVNGVQKGVAKKLGNKNGYIELTAEIKDYKYSKKAIKEAKLPHYGDAQKEYKNLQKAQDKLISSWNKLSKEGFSSREEDVLDVLKAFREYQTQAKRQYSKTEYEVADKQLGRIRATIGTQINNYLTKLLGPSWKWS